jgi:DNA-binding IclR family transcriptional regulator
MPAARDGRSVTGRVLDILACFSRARPELTLGEIARAAHLSPATASRRAQELTDWGALERGEDGRFRIGMRLWELSALAPLGMSLRERAMPFLEDLVELTGGNAQLAIRSGTETLFIERLVGDSSHTPLTGVAIRFPTTVTAVGLLLLAHAPVEVQEEVLALPVAAFSPKTVTDPRQLRRMLQDARRNGYAISDGQLEESTYSVGAPITEADGRVIAALGAVIMHGEQDRTRVVGTVVAAARALSRQML